MFASREHQVPAIVITLFFFSAEDVYIWKTMHTSPLDKTVNLKSVDTDFVLFCIQNHQKFNFP